MSIPLIASTRDRRRGRGAVTNPTGRYEPAVRETFEDGWAFEDELPSLDTEIIIEKPRTIIARNDSPDIGFDRSINPYRGCEHGCSIALPGPVTRSRAFPRVSISRPRSSPSPALPSFWRRSCAQAATSRRPSRMGVEHRSLSAGRAEASASRAQILEVLNRTNHPVGIVTKSALVTRDIDILSQMADRQLAKVAISITTLDPKLARKMEPRAASPAKRLDTVRRLSEAGIPVTVLVAPIIPAINDHEIEAILKASYAAGAREAGYVLLRLPHDLKELMRDWLAEHYPDKLNHVFSLLQEARGGKDYDSGWGVRQTGVGPYAWMLGRRFETATARLGMNTRRIKLRTDLLRAAGEGQGSACRCFDNPTESGWGPSV